MTRATDDSVKVAKPRRIGVSGKILLIFIAAALVGALVEWRRPPELVKWRDNLEAARNESRATGKPLLLYFTADWCGPCQQMRRTTWADARVMRAMDAYVPMKVDIDQQPDLARHHSVDAIPRLIVLDQTGSVHRSSEGLVDPEAMVQWLDDVTARQSPVSVETRK